LATGVFAALAVAAPVAEASAATPITVPLPAFASAVVAPLLSSIGPSTQVAAAIAGPAIGDVFNGGTTVVISTSAAFGTVIASP
jgi:hypothetical protein